MLPMTTSASIALWQRSISFKGSLGAVNDALASLVYRSEPGWQGIDTLQTSVNGVVQSSADMQLGVETATTVEERLPAVLPIGSAATILGSVLSTVVPDDAECRLVALTRLGAEAALRVHGGAFGKEREAARGDTEWRLRVGRGQG